MPDSKSLLGGGSRARCLDGRGRMYGPAWAVLSESDHPVTGGAVFSVIFFLGEVDRNSTLRKGQRSQFDVGLDDGDIFHAVQVRSSKFLGAGVCLHLADPLLRNDPPYPCPPIRPGRTLQTARALSMSQTSLIELFRPRAAAFSVFI